MPNRTISNFVGSSGGSSPSAIRKVLVAVGVGAICRKADAEMMQVFSKIRNRRDQRELGNFAVRLRGDEDLMALVRKRRAEARENFDMRLRGGEDLMAVVARIARGNGISS